MKVISAQKGIDKQKKVPFYHSISGRIFKKSSEDSMLFWIEMIADQFWDGWHQHIMDLFAGQTIVAIFGDRWHKWKVENWINTLP